MLQPKDLRGPPLAPSPCPTSLATGRSSDRRTLRICSKFWVRRFLSARERRGGSAEASEVGTRKKGKLESGRGKLGACIPKNRGQTPGSRGAEPEHLNPSSSGGAPTDANSCGDSASESSRNQKHEVGIPWGEAVGFSAVRKLQTLHPGWEPGSLPSRASHPHPRHSCPFPLPPAGNPIPGQIPDLSVRGSTHQVIRHRRAPRSPFQNFSTLLPPPSICETNIFLQRAAPES